MKYILSIINYFMPKYLNINSSDPDEIDDIERNRVFISTFLIFSLISFGISILNFIGNNHYSVQGLAQLIVSGVLIAVLIYNKHFNALSKLNLPLYIGLYSFFYYKITHYQTIQCSIIIWFIFVPVVINYIFSTRFTIISCLTGIGLNTFTFITYDMPRMTLLTDLQQHTLKSFFLASNVGSILVILFFILKNNSTKKWRKVAINNIQEVAQKNHLLSLGDLSGQIAHEINNPLAIIKMSHDKLKRADLTEEQRQLLTEKVDRTLHRISSLIKSLLEVFKPTQNTKTFKQFNEIIDVINPILEEKKVFSNININIDNKIQETVLFNVKDFGQIILHLILNSIQALKETNNATVNICTKEENDNVIINVIDNGPGIPKDFHNKVFEPLFTTDSKSGTGVGLSLCHSIINRYNGKIKIIDTEKGCHFEISVPKNKLNI